MKTLRSVESRQR